MNKTAKCSAQDRRDIQGSREALPVTVALIIKKLKHYT